MSFGKKLIKRALNSMGLVPLSTYNAREQELIKWKKTIWEPGHYYSPQPDITGIPDKAVIDAGIAFPGIDMNENAQLILLDDLSKLYTNDLLPAQPAEGYRYYSENDYFGYSDGIFLNTIIRHFKPNRIIEIGSGFSSALMLDTRERFLNNQLKLHFIEPYPEERLLQLIKGTDDCIIIKDFVQNVSMTLWQSLEENDILFIDSSHVSKYNSDVNHLFFNVVPTLKPGVIVHVHDVFFPFEYPAEWLKQGRAWSEAYLLRAFLQFNSEFEILIFTSYMEERHEAWFRKNMPA